MAGTFLWAMASVLAVSLLSLVGILGLYNKALLRHRTMMFLVSLAAGTLIGDAFLHLLPEASGVAGFGPRLGFGVIGGFPIMFLLEAGLRPLHSHVEAVDAEHPGTEHAHVEPFGTLNLAGDAVHNLLDGAAIAAAYLLSVPVGIATTIAVAVHEITPELGDFAALTRSGMAPKKALLLNLAAPSPPSSALAPSSR
jgi:zinc and cadmium transporter